MALLLALSTPLFSQNLNDKQTSGASDQVLTRYSFRNAAKIVAPSVVNIKIKSNFVLNGKQKSSSIPPIFGFDDEMREKLEKLFERESPYFTPNDQEELKYARSGSGVIVKNDGYIVTSHHVVRDVNDSDIEVSLPDGRSFSTVSIIGTDEFTDLAVLKIDSPSSTSLPSVNWGNSDELQVGDFVIAIGNPLEFNNSVSQGIVSAKHRSIKKASIEDLIQTTAMINPGNSGGALVDLDGHLVGINMAIATSTGLWSGLGFAIPSNLAKDVTDQIIDKGKVNRGYLGIEMNSLLSGLAQQLGYEFGTGIIVKDVHLGSAAEKAGLQRYDIISKVDGKPIKDYSDMHKNIGARLAGETVTLEVYRDEGSDQLTKKEIKVILGERPTQDELDRLAGKPNGKNEPKLPGAEPSKNQLGLNVEPEVDKSGLKIISIETNSDAANSDLKIGDVITQVNRQAVTTIQEFQQALDHSKNGGHLFIVKRDGNTQMLSVPMN